MYDGQDRNSDPPSKRYRRDESADPTNPNPSIVVHVRNLSAKATEADLLEALSTFGPIAYATCMHAQRMALVEFEDIEGARACVTFAATNMIFVAGQAALFNYSTSQCIQRLGFESETPNKVLVLTIYNVQYPINVDVIHEICAPHGHVRRIAIVRKMLLQALVEYDSADVAKTAKHAMNGADIYSGCCTLKVEFAKPSCVKVTRQDHDQRDYTLPADAVPGHEPHQSNRKTLIQGDGPGGAPAGPFGAEYGRGSYSGSDRGSFRGRGRGRGGPQIQSSSVQYGTGYADSYGEFSATHDGYQSYQEGGYGGYSRGDDYGYHGGYSHGMHSQSYGSGGQGCVIMVYGIDHNKINCDKLFNLLCLFGNVLRIRFMLSKLDTCMVELSSLEAVNNVLDHLQGVNLFGLTLQFKPSKQEGLHDVRDPFDLPDGTPSYRDYSASRNQRFSNPEAAARNRIVYPTHILHWYNAPGNMDEERIKELFVERNAPVPKSIFIFNSRSERSSSGTVEFETVEQANEALVLANHTPVVSPTGKAPYIVKIAYATPRRFDMDSGPGVDGNATESGSYEEGRDDIGANGHHQGGMRGGYRGRGRGRGTFRSLRGFRGGYRGRGGGYAEGGY